MGGTSSSDCMSYDPQKPLPDVPPDLQPHMFVMHTWWFHWLKYPLKLKSLSVHHDVFQANMSNLQHGGHWLSRIILQKYQHAGIVGKAWTPTRLMQCLNYA